MSKGAQQSIERGFTFEENNTNSTPTLWEIRKRVEEILADYEGISIDDFTMQVIQDIAKRTELILGDSRWSNNIDNIIIWLIENEKRNVTIKWAYERYKKFMEKYQKKPIDFDIFKHGNSWTKSKMWEKFLHLESEWINKSDIVVDENWIKYRVLSITTLLDIELRQVWKKNKKDNFTTWDVSKYKKIS